MRLTLPIACLGAALLVAPAFAQQGEGEPDFARDGPYVGIGGVFLVPGDWTGDFENNFEGEATRIATKNAREALEQIQPGGSLNPPQAVITISGTELDELWGAGGVLGYRVSPNLGLEFEGEWIAESNASSFTIENTGDVGRVEIDELWTVTANVRVYPLTGRIQPFAVVGVGVYHAQLEVSARSVGNTTTGEFGNPPMPIAGIPADFTLIDRKTKTDGVVRAGVGLDVYLTPEIAGEAKVDYVIPFVETGLLDTDYLSVRLGLLYRF